MMHYCNVVLNRDNAIDTNHLFVNENERVVNDTAEAKFRDIVKEIDPTVTDEDMEIYLDNGYMESGNLCVCICWPEVN